MAKFRGEKNLHLGGDEPWASSVWDDEARAYVVEVSGKDADRFRKVADGYGFVEDEPAAKAAPAARSKKGED